MCIRDRLGTGPMAGGQRDGLVEEEQLGVETRAHDSAPPPPEAGEARDPAPPLRVADDAPLRIVQPPAIAHEQAAALDGHEVAERRDAILQRHDRATISRLSLIHISEPTRLLS